MKRIPFGLDLEYGPKQALKAFNALLTAEVVLVSI